MHRIEHQATGAYIEIDYSQGYFFRYWPKPIAGVANAQSWPGVRASLEKAESDAPDLWEVAKQERAWLTADGAALDNQPLTANQLEQIALHLRTIEEFAIKTFELQERESAFVRTQLRYLAEAAGRVGRIDFKNLTVSTFIKPPIAGRYRADPQAPHKNSLTLLAA